MPVTVSDGYVTMDQEEGASSAEDTDLSDLDRDTDDDASDEEGVRDGRKRCTCSDCTRVDVRGRLLCRASKFNHLQAQQAAHRERERAKRQRDIILAEDDPFGEPQTKRTRDDDELLEPNAADRPLASKYTLYICVYTTYVYAYINYIHTLQSPQVPTRRTQGSGTRGYRYMSGGWHAVILSVSH